MTEKELDRLMRQVLIDAAKRDQTSRPGPAFRPSRAYQRQVRAMLRDPLRWSARRSRPALSPVMRQAAMFALVTVLGLAATVASVPSARASVVRWVEEWSGMSVVFRHDGNYSDTAVPEYTIETLPDGFYEESREHLGENMTTISYTDGAGNYIDFTYMRMSQGGAVGIDGDKSTDIASKVTVNHMKGWMWKTSEENGLGNDTITWIDEESDIQFTIQDFNRKSIDVLHMAESVNLVKTPN